MRKFRAVFLLLFALVIALAGCGNNIPAVSEKPAQQVQTQKEQISQPVKPPIPLIQTTITKVIDGDTIQATVYGKDETIRLIGVDTPETVHPSKPVQTYGKEASDYTKSQLSGKTVWLEKDVQERDKYGRLLAYVWTSQPVEISDTEIRAKMFNARLLLDGYAQLLTIPPDVKYTDYFTKYQAEARNNNRGLWGLPPEPVVTPTPQTTPPVVEKQEVTVYVTRTGSKYHRSGCRYLARSCIPISLEDAKTQGYGPCSICGPPW